VAEIKRVQNPKKLSEKSIDCWEKVSRGKINFGARRDISRSNFSEISG